MAFSFWLVPPYGKQSMPVKIDQLITSYSISIQSLPIKPPALCDFPVLLFLLVHDDEKFNKFLKIAQYQFRLV